MAFHYIWINTVISLEHIAVTLAIFKTKVTYVLELIQNYFQKLALLKDSEIREKYHHKITKNVLF